LASQIFTACSSCPPVTIFVSSGEYITTCTDSCPVLIGPMMVSPLLRFHTLAVPSHDPLTTRSRSALQHTDSTAVVCPINLAMTFLVSTSHNLTVPSVLPLATVPLVGDNAIVHTAFFSPSSRQSSPICAPLSRFHSRSEPSHEPVIIRCPPGRCTAPLTQSV
jgi:hypothetical protein